MEKRFNHAIMDIVEVFNERIWDEANKPNSRFWYTIKGDYIRLADELIDDLENHLAETLSALKNWTKEEKEHALRVSMCPYCGRDLRDDGYCEHCDEQWEL